MSKKNKYPLNSYLDTLLEANELLRVVDDLTHHKVVGLNKKKQALYRNLIINLSACFEVFLCEILEQSIDYMIENADSSKKIPFNVKIRISELLLSSKDNRKIWEISDKGWKIHLKKNYIQLTDKFNSPRPENIDDYFYKSIGIKSITKTFKWKGKSCNKSIATLNEFLNLRGKITHNYKISNPVHYNDIKYYADFLYRIAICINNYVSNYLKDITGKFPWHQFPIQSITK